MEFNVGGVLESLFDKHNSEFMDLVSADSETATQNVDLIKNILRQAKGLAKTYPFIKGYLKDESVSLVKLTHHAGSYNVRMVTQFQGDPVIVDIPLDELDVASGQNQAKLKADGELALHYKGDTVHLELTEQLLERLAESGWDSFCFPSKASRLGSNVLTEQSLSAGTYIKQKMMEMMENDPLFAFDAFLSGGETSMAFDYIEEQAMGGDALKKRLAFLLVSGLYKEQLKNVIDRLDRLNATALLDGLSEQEVSQLMSYPLASKDVWSNPGTTAIIQALITESSSRNIKCLQQSIDQLSLVSVPDNITAMMNAEIMNNYSRADKSTKKGKLKL